MISLCKALMPIHRNGYVYMDCKPDNIFLYSDNSLQDHVYLFDFDAIINADYVHHKEEYRAISSSPGWRAPELEGYNPAKRSEHEKISYAADIYSVGLVFLWLLTGKEPDLDVNKRTEWINKIFTGKFEWNCESEFCRNASQEAINAISNILKKMLIRDQKERMDLLTSYTEPGRPPRAVYFYMLIHDFQELYSLTFGNDPYYGSVYDAIERSQEKFLEQSLEAQKSINDHISAEFKNLIYLLNKNGVIQSDIIIQEDEAQGNRYEGETENGIPSGTGVFYLSGGDRFEGTFKDGKPFGKLTYYYGQENVQIEKLEGEFYGFQLPSNGRLVYFNGDVYNGQIESGIPQGYGEMVYHEGDKYNGNFSKGLREGTGVLNFNNGDIFVGEFIKNDWVRGTLCSHKTFDKYEGCFENGMKSGRGKVTYSDGSCREGLFSDGELCGPVVFTDKDGKNHEEYYINGNKADHDIFAASELDDPMFQIMKVEYLLLHIRKKDYSFTTNPLALKVCNSIRKLLITNDGKSLLKRKASIIKEELSLCKKKYADESIRSGDTSLYQTIQAINAITDLIGDCKESTMGWGPERHMYDKLEFVPYPTINSRKDNPVLGDERAFVHFKKHGEKSFNNDIPEIAPGEKYDIRIYYNNNADDSIGEQFGSASNVRLSTYFPVVLKKNIKGEIGGVVSSSNSSPEAVWAQRYIRTSFEKLYIRYVPGTAILHNNGAIDGIHLSDELFTEEGTYIGKDALDGTLPGGTTASGYVDYTIEAEERSGTVKQTVSYDGINYQDTISVSLGADIYFRITITNIGDKALTNVVIKGLLSDGLQFVPGSVMLLANNSGKYDHLSDSYINNGYDLGKVGIGNEIDIYYKCSVNKDLMTRDIIVSSVLLVYDSEVKEGDQKYVTTVIRISKDSISPWGPSRKTFTNANPAPYVTFNSITDNAGVGDERNFVRIREANANDKFADEVKIKAGKVYEVYIYYQNDASPSFANTSKGIAQDVRVKSSFPHMLTANKKYIVNATLSSSNSVPSSVWDGAYVTANEKLILQYVPKSLRIHSYTETHGQILNADELFSENGTFISAYIDKPGVITSKSGENSGHITYCLFAKKNDLYDKTDEDIDFPIFNSIISHPKFGNERQFVRIRSIGEKQWYRSVCLQEGLQYDVEIFFRNDSSSQYNGKAYNHKGVAVKSTVAINLPQVIDGEGKLLVKISAENAREDSVDEIVLSTSVNERLKIKYIAGSAKILNEWKTNENIMPSTLFNYPKGTLIGLNELNGVIPGGDEYAGYIRFVIEVSNPQFNQFR